MRRFEALSKRAGDDADRNNQAAPLVVNDVANVHFNFLRFDSHHWRTENNLMPYPGSSNTTRDGLQQVF